MSNRYLLNPGWVGSGLTQRPVTSRARRRQQTHSRLPGSPARLPLHRSAALSQDFTPRSAGRREKRPALTVPAPPILFTAVHRCRTPFIRHRSPVTDRPRAQLNTTGRWEGRRDRRRYRPTQRPPSHSTPRTMSSPAHRAREGRLPSMQTRHIGPGPARLGTHSSPTRPPITVERVGRFAFAV